MLVVLVGLMVVDCEYLQCAACDVVTEREKEVLKGLVRYTS